MQTTLPYQAKTLPNNPNLIAIPVKDFVIIVKKRDFEDFVDAAEQIKRGKVFNDIGEHPNGNRSVLVRQNQNGGKVYAMFFSALVIDQTVPIERITERAFNLANDSIVVHEVRGGKLSAKKELLRHKSTAIATSLRKLSVYS